MLVKQLVKQGLLARNAVILSRASYHDPHHKPISMNDMPTPEGDWYEQHSRQNSQHNAVLATGVLFLAGTIAFVKASGAIQFNSETPESYE